MVGIFALAPGNMCFITVMTRAVRKGRWPKRDLYSGVEDVLPLILEWLGEQGVDAMIRVDAARVREGRPPWTFAAHGGPLSLGMRADGSSVQECMSSAIDQLRKAGLVVPF